MPIPLAALFLLAQGPATPPASPGQTVTVAPVTAEGQAITYGIIEGKGQPKPKKVCFNDAQSGSKIPVKRCMDRKVFEQQKNDARDQIYRIQSDVRSPTGD
ncbi:hypothetical protein [Phenylobacterium sp.]|uniref:hypothetical protein n=1 Tax=Phenylobacterium sp. TaxID=1871053 RepID=UPI0025D5FFC1|nr:hypothetical protein [Phenylobacterium sp.]MBX3484238.1 hypothetical protein [Phenylobacterium sp.]MCW5760222.1 hypothetical protein [Phenylobacterium sp.]